jgi:hypothetical protein
MTRDFQDEYDRSEVERHGGSSGNYTADPAQMDPAQFEPDYYEPAQAPQESAYEDSGLEFDPEVGYDGSEGPDDFLDEDAIREMVHEEVDPELVDPEAHMQAWNALRAEQAGQSAQAMAAEVANLQEGYAALEAHVNEAVNGRLAGYGEYAQPFTEAVGLQMHELAAELGTELVNAGHDPAAVGDALERNMPMLVQRAVQLVRDEQSIADMKRSVRAHFLGSR